MYPPVKINYAHPTQLDYIPVYSSRNVLVIIYLLMSWDETSYEVRSLLGSRWALHKYSIGQRSPLLTYKTRASASTPNRQ